MASLNLRERALTYGPHTLTDVELLAILLRTGTRSTGVLGLARTVVDAIAGKNLLDLAAADLKRIPGLGVAKAASILAAVELVKRHSTNRPQVLCPDDAVKCAHDLLDRRTEHFTVLYLNTKKMLLARETIGAGTVDAAPVDPKTVFHPALKHNATCIILLHNHPSGDPTPSPEDREVTRRLAAAGELLTVEVVDHIIIAHRGRFSFKEHGLL